MLKGQLNELWFEDKLKRFSNEFKFNVRSQRKYSPSRRNCTSCSRSSELFLNKKTTQVLKINTFCSKTKSTNTFRSWMWSSTPLISRRQLKAILSRDDRPKRRRRRRRRPRNRYPFFPLLQRTIKTDIYYGPSVFSSVQTIQSSTLHRRSSQNLPPGGSFQNQEYQSFHQWRTCNQSAELFPLGFGLIEGHFVCLPAWNQKNRILSMADVCKVHTVGKEFYQEDFFQINGPFRNIREVWSPLQERSTLSTAGPQDKNNPIYTK